MTTPKIYEFYFPKTKSKHIAKPVKGKVYPSKGGTVRYGIQATMNGSMSLPKYIKEEEFNRLGFGAEEKKNCGCGQDPCMTYGAETTMTVEHKDGSKYRYSETDPIYDIDGEAVGHVSEITDEKDTPYQPIYDAEIEGNVEYERMEERTVDVRQEIEQPFSVQTDPAEYEHEYPEDIENAIKHGIHNQLSDNPDSKLAREGGFIENIETDIEVVDLEDDPDSEPRELTAYGDLGKPEVNDEEEYYRQAKITDIEKEFRNEGVYEGSPYDRVLHEKGDYRIIAEENYDPYGAYEEEYQEAADEYGMYQIQVQKKVMGGWKTIDSLKGVVPSDTVSLEDLALTEMEIPDGVIFEATSGSGQISHNPIDVVKQRPAIMRHDHAFTHYDWNTGNYDLTDEQEDELDERIREEITSEPSEGHMDFEIDDVAEDDDGDFITANVDAYTNYGEGRFYGFDAETVGNPSPSSPLEETPATVPSPAEPTNENFSAEGEIVYVLEYTTPDGFPRNKIRHKEYYLDDYGGSEKDLLQDMEDETNWFEYAWKTATIMKGKVGSPFFESVKTLTYESETFESQNSNMKLALGLSALGIGLAFWKGKEVMSLWDSITSRLKK